MSSFVFIDSRVPDYERLIAGLGPDTQVVILDPGLDGVTQIADALADVTDLDSIHIISHGSSGTLYLGSTILTEENLDDYETELAQIGDALSEDGDLLLYGCNVGEGTTGQSFIASLAQYTGADVAASTDATGSAALGGDWVLEASIGAIETGAVVTQGGQDGYLSLLAAPPTELYALNGTSGFRFDGGAANDFSGRSVSNAGDVNGDGFDDVIVGAFGADPNGLSSAGVSYVVFGKASGFLSSSDLSALNGTTGFKLNGVALSDASGRSVSAAGDVNGDGIGDLIVGAPSADPNGSASGVGYVVFGSTSFGANVDLSSLNGVNGFRLNGVSEFDEVGRSVSAAGDVNGDGYEDLIVGAPYADPLGQQPGASYVVYGKASGFASSLNLSSVNGTTGFRIEGAEYDRSGWSVSSAGDIDGDGYDDLIVGAPNYALNYYGGAPGASYVIFGDATGFASGVSVTTLNGANGFRITGETGTDYSGRSVSNAGDVNGDGFDDIIIGASGAAPNGSGSGASYVVFGKAAGFASNISLTALNGANGFQISGVTTGDVAGYSVSGAGDVNGDGFDDLLVGAFGVNVSGYDYTYANAGAAYVVYGKAFFGSNFNLSALSGSTGFRLAGVYTGYETGRSVSAAGDVNGDGFDDLVIGAPYADPHGNYSGSGYVVFGGNFTNTVTYLGGNGNETQTGTSFRDYFVSGQGNDTIISGGGGDVIRAGAGDDRIVISDVQFATEPMGGFPEGGSLDGGSGIDTLVPGGDLDLNFAAFRNHRVSGIEAIDLTAGNHDLSLTVLDLIDVLNNSNTLRVEADSGDTVTLNGAVSMAWIRSGGYDRFPQGGVTLMVDTDVAPSRIGTDGLSERLTGTAAADTIYGGAGNDTIDGQNGIDRATYAAAGWAVTVNLATGIVSDGAYGDSLISIEEVEGSALGDDLIGNGGANTLLGLGGSDTITGGDGSDMLDGGGGTDRVSYASAGAGVTASLAVAGAQATGGAGSDVLAGFEELEGSTSGDNLAGDDSTNVVLGRGGDDTITGGDGNDALDGGSGIDRVSYANAGASVMVSLAAAGVQATGGAGSDTLLDFEELEGSAFGDQLAGNGAANLVLGLGGADVLTGGNGDDSLDGGSGFDTMTGGSGSDTYVVDSYSINDPGARDIVVENNGGAEGVDVVQSSVTYTLPSSVEILLLGGSAAINGTGNNLPNEITGNSAANRLDGKEGIDILTGGSGNDVYVVDNPNDQINEYAGEGNDLVRSIVTYALPDSGDGCRVERLLLTGTANIDATGNSLRNTLTGNSGNNSLNGGGGNDTMLGGAGNDTYVVDTTLEVVTENPGGGTDLVRSSVTWTLGADVENLLLTGTANRNGMGNTDANDLTGNSGDNVLIGGAGADSLDGGAGNDTLRGGAGTDTLRGGTGTDSMEGGTGNDVFYVDTAADVVVEAANGDTADQVVIEINFTAEPQAFQLYENIELVSVADVNGGGILVIGNALDNLFAGGNGDDSLDGAAGDDTLDGAGGQDTLQGGSGVDSMLGGDGADLYYVDDAGDQVIETGNGPGPLAGGPAAADEFTDTVIAFIDYSLSSVNYVENLTLDSTATSGTGNELNNVITGNSLGNTLLGLSGADTIVGAAGKDTLTGGAGADLLKGSGGSDRLTGEGGGDTFDFSSMLNAISNVDRIMDFASGVDHIQLDHTIFTALAVGNLAGGAFYNGSAAHDAGDRIIYNETSGSLYYDADGSGAASSAILFATLAGAPAVAYTDLFIVA